MISSHRNSSIVVRLAPVLVAFVLGSCAVLRLDRGFKAHQDDWMTYGGGPMRANTTVASVEPPLKQVWQYNAEAGIAATPLVCDSVLLISTMKGELHAVDISTGKRLGFVALDGPVSGTPVWKGGIVFIPIASENNTMESYILQSGSKNWSSKLGPTESSPLLLDNSLYVTSLNGILYCLNSVNGEEVWKFKTDSEEKRKPIRSSPASDGDVIVFGCDDGGIYGIDRKSGTSRWRYQTGQSVFASPVISLDRVIVGSLDGKVYCLKTQTGVMSWIFDTGSRVFGTGAVGDSVTFFGTADGYCYALNTESGTLVWKFKARSVINSAPLITRNLVFVGSLDKSLYALDVRTGKKVWEYMSEGRIKVPPVIWGGRLLVASEDSYVTALK